LLGLVPSIWPEAFGIVVIEAMASGRPVIASRIGGIPDLVRDEVTGLLVQNGDAEALAAAMIRLLADRELASRLGAAALEFSHELRWTPDDYAARVRTLVDRTLASSTR